MKAVALSLANSLTRVLELSSLSQSVNRGFYAYSLPISNLNIPSSSFSGNMAAKEQPHTAVLAVSGVYLEGKSLQRMYNSVYISLRSILFH